LTFGFFCVNFDINSIAKRFFAVCCGKRIAIIPVKPYKIRNRTMKNFVKNASENSSTNPMKNQMLKWANEGGGGPYVV
jgi:hypothetical protein